jgi:TP901 family phage tail tape measure protein
VANRTTKVSLVAEVSGYISGMQSASQKTRELGSEAEKLGQEAFEGLGRSALAFGAVAAAAVGLAVAKYAEFDQAMSSVQAATHASTEEQQQLRDAAIEAGSSTVYTATQAANAIEELSKAGVSSSDILGGGLAGALSLASAGELEVADAAQIAATAMTQFNQEGSQVPHVADLLAAGAGKAQGSVKDLSAALNQGGLVASQAGFSIEETTGTLAAFASAGLLGSDAGTSLKTAIIALQNPSKQSAKVMDEYGINVYDTSGKMLSFGAIAAQLKDKLGGLTDEQRNSALAQIFGNDAVRAANVLYAEGGDGIADWTSKVNDNGYAAETARLKLDNLKGDVEKLGGAFDTALIKSGSSANGTLRSLTQGATFLVDVVGSVPGPVMVAGVGLTALAGGVALVGGGALIAVPKLAAMKVQLDTMGVSLKTAATRTAVAGAAFGGIAVGIGVLISMQAQAKAATEELTGTLDEQTGAVTKYTRASVARRLSEGGQFEAARKAGVSQRELTDAVLEGGDALEKVQGKLGSRNTFGGMFTGAAEEAGWAQLNIKNVADSVRDGQKAFRDQKAATDDSVPSTKSAADAYKEEADRVDSLNSELQQLIDQIDTANSANQDAISSNASYQEALAGLSDQVKQQRDSVEGYSNTLDENTAVGSGNAAMLSDVASKAQDAAAKQYALDQSTMSSKDAADKYASTLSTQRQKFEDAAVAAGFNRDEVHKLGDQIFQLPTAKQIQVLVDTAGADAAITRISDRLGVLYSYSGRHINIIADVSGPGAAAVATGHVAYAEGAVVDFYADGGVSENHVAQIAPGGAMRLWAEPETGGEAYIPLAQSKRTRSLAIWEETGRRLQAFADGGSYSQPNYVPTPPQLVYAQAPASSPAGGSPVFAPVFTSSGSQQRDIDEARWLWKTTGWGARADTGRDY